jgi:hypothetical protein
MVGVEFCNYRFALHVRGERVNCWCHHSTGATPISVKIDGHGNIALADRARKRIVVQSHGALEQDRLSAFSAFRPVDHLARLDAIPRIAELAPHGKLFGDRCCFRLHRRSGSC